jgi:hypothetical protein
MLALAFSGGAKGAEVYAAARTMIDPTADEAAQRNLVSPEISGETYARNAKSPKIRGTSGSIPEALASVDTASLPRTDVASPVIVDNGTSKALSLATATTTSDPTSATLEAGDSGPVAPAPASAPTTTPSSSTTQASPTPSTTRVQATTTTGAPKSTTTANAPAPAGSTLLRAPIDGMGSFGFDRSQSVVTAALESQFPTLKYESGSNWDDISIVQDPTGDYLRTRSNVGDNSRKQFNAPIPISNETYLVYRFYLEPGFDAGDGNGDEGSPVWGTGIKMPGLMRGNPADNTGGNHTSGGFSGRLMIRGTRKSDGANDKAREGLSLGAYIYGQEIDNANITSGYGEDYFLLDGFGSHPFEGIDSGKREGVGDPRIWDLEVGRWVTVVLGYRVDSDDGWFKAWTMTEGIDAVPKPRLHVPRVNWMGSGPNQGADSLLFQQFWGGSGSVWYPDSTSYMRFKDFGVYVRETDALEAAR